MSEIDRGSRQEPTIRRARPAEAELLTELALRSKAHWGYDETFMAACRADLTVTPGYIAGGLLYVLADGGTVQGWYGLQPAGATAVLADLWVAPAAMGRGYGKRLWQHLVATARALPADRLRIDADPNAEGFYQAMGAVRVGEAPSTAIPGRVLPLMQYDLRGRSPRMGE